MRLAELSERSGVSAAMIKYYLRQGMLAPGRKVGATTAEYDESHLRRLRLVRALIEVGRLPSAKADKMAAVALHGREQHVGDVDGVSRQHPRPHRSPPQLRLPPRTPPLPRTSDRAGLRQSAEQCLQI